MLLFVNFKQRVTQFAIKVIYLSTVNNTDWINVSTIQSDLQKEKKKSQRKRRPWVPIEGSLSVSVSVSLDYSKSKENILEINIYRINFNF